MANWFSKALVKSFGAMRHSGGMPFLFGYLKRTRFDYAREVGDGLDASVVLAPVQWIQRAMPEARLRVVRRKADGETQEIVGHGMTALVARPNPFHGDIHLWMATLLSFLIAGNAYWLKVRNQTGKPAELWWVPWWMMKPKWPEDGSVFISHYEYKPGGGTTIRLDVDDVVHFRHGVDPRNTRLGLSPLNGVLREIFTDLESSNFVAALLKNMGVPGVVISPDGGAQPAPEDVEAVKSWFSQAFGGDNRGAPLVMGGATKVQEYGFNPQQMDLSVIRDVAEERVCASLGIPAAVAGFGAGLQSTKVGATMAEMCKLAWTNGVLPVTRMLADELNRSLLPDFSKAAGAEEVEFDVSDVKALADDMEKLFTRMTSGVQGGWVQVAEAREAAGFDVADHHRIYLRPFSAIEVPDGPASTRTRSDERANDQRGATRTRKKARRRPTAGQRGYVTALARMETSLADNAAKHLQRFFEDLGKAASEAAGRIPVIEFGEAARASGESKQEDLLVARILAELDVAAHQIAFRKIYERHYLEVAREVAKAGKLVGIATDLPDTVGRAVVAAGGRRAGLVDLTAQSRQAMFDALAEGRAAGEGVAQLAARIGDEVGAGPWASAESRARIIARTETKFAQNTSTIAISRDAGADRFVVFDGRLGPGRSDPDHIARDGIIVTADEAAQLTADEHPNGTLSFAPHFDLQEDDE